MVDNPMVTITGLSDNSMGVEVKALSESGARSRIGMWMMRNVSPVIRDGLEVRNLREVESKRATYAASITKR